MKKKREPKEPIGLAFGQSEYGNLVRVDDVLVWLESRGLDEEAHILRQAGMEAELMSMTT